MAFALSTSSKLGCSRVSSTRQVAARKTTKSTVVRAAAAAGEVPDMGKRNVMNLLLVGAIGLPATSLVGGYAYFFVPPR
jgi:cytochrome b6-f complex iron-sulfur subunit